MGRDGREELGDDGLGWIDNGAMTFAGWQGLAEFAYGGAGGGEGRGWGSGSGWEQRGGIRGVLAVPYIPVQGSPGVFRES